MNLFQRMFKKFWELENNILYLSILVAVVLSIAFIPNYFSLGNLNSTLITMSSICVLGLGTTFVLTAGEFDISIGALMSVAVVILAALIQVGCPVILAIALGFLAVLGIGALSGFITIKIGLPSFIATLGTQGVAMGISRTVSGNVSIPVTSKELVNLFGGDFLGMKATIWWMIILVVVAFILLHKTKFGRNLQCVGDKRAAAFLYGLNIKKTVILAFMVSATFAFLAGMMMLGRTSYAQAGAGESLTLNAIVAAVIGGTFIQGGKGSIVGTFIGAFFMAIIQSSMFAMNFTSWTSNIFIGIVILIVLTINSRRQIWAIEKKRT